MIPSFVYLTGVPHGVLPPGIHYASLEEIEGRFCFNEHRRKLFQGIVALVRNLEAAGCRTFYLDGSYVTEKPLPGDFDGCWDPVGVMVGLLDPVLLEFDNERAAQKERYGGEVFPAVWPATKTGSSRFLEFFQQDKGTGQSKGIVGLRLDEMQ
jgi:hypothetical protein